MLKELGIVILNYNNFNLSILAIDRLLELSNEIKIVVVDNNSTNNSKDILKNRYKENKQIKIIFNKENGGYSKGNNIGLKYFIEDIEIKYIGIMNPDVIIPNKNVFFDCLKVLKLEKNAALVFPIMIQNNKVNFFNLNWKIPTKVDDLFLCLGNKFGKRLSRTNLEVYNIENTIFYTKSEGFSGSFFIMKKDILKEIGYLDENTFLYCEERILGNKIKSVNKKVFLLLNQFYYHNHKDSENKLLHYNYFIDSVKYYNLTYNGKIGKIISKVLIIYKILHYFKYGFLKRGNNK